MKNGNIKFSIRLNLDQIIFDASFEEEVMSKIYDCNKRCIGHFELILWNKNISTENAKAFIDRYDKNLNIRITKDFSTNVWFLIDTSLDDESTYRYKWNGEILDGVDKYLDIINHINKRKN